MNPDYLQAHQVITAFDAAVAQGDVDAVVAQISFDTPHGADFFRRKLTDLGIGWFRRKIRGNRPRCIKDTDDWKVFHRDAFLVDGSICIDKFGVALIDGQWRLGCEPGFEIWSCHPELGPIHFITYQWETHRYVPALRQVVLIGIPGNERGPVPHSVQVLKQICADQEEKWPAICEVLLEFYNKYIFDRFFVNDDAGNDVTHLYAPPVTDPMQLWGMLWPRFGIRMARKQSEDGACQFTLDCECQWDEEHGLGIQFNSNWEVVDFCGSGE